MHLIHRQQRWKVNDQLSSISNSYSAVPCLSFSSTDIPWEPGKGWDMAVWLDCTETVMLESEVPAQALTQHSLHWQEWIPGCGSPTCSSPNAASESLNPLQQCLVTCPFVLCKPNLQCLLCGRSLIMCRAKLTQPEGTLLIFCTHGSFLIVCLVCFI